MSFFIVKPLFFSLVIFIVSLVFANSVFAETTPFRSARIITEDSWPHYTGIDNCIVTDGKTCDRAYANSYGNLYFRDFGTYSEFGMPEGAKITKVRIRVTGKATTSIYVGLSSGTTFRDNCQSPSDLWPLSLLVGQAIKTQTFVTEVVDQFKPQTVRSYCLTPYTFNNNSFIWRINYASAQTWSANIDNFEIAFDYNVQATPTPTPSPTPTPTATPTPTPAGPMPFLDLPWDYGGKGLSFNEAANAITSFFDHQYPLLSSGLGEPFDVSSNIMTYKGPPNTNDNYSSHDGYDYAKLAQVNIGDPIFAAAAGEAVYIDSCTPCGNMIVIDHKNGFQTRYMHMLKDGLITTISGQKVSVSAREPIGKVGATGNVFPSGDMGAHIHFMVVEDKNKDGNFYDNIPDGVTDPFGWQAKEPDPWPLFVFDYGGKPRTGNKSYYLWTKKLDNLDANLTANGGIFATERYKVNFPQNSTNENLKLSIVSSPIVSVLNSLRSVGSSVNITATNALNQLVTSFSNLFTISVDFSSFDLGKYNKDTLSIYSSSNGTDWIKEPTNIDFVTKTASASINHLTHFALMAERMDTTAPKTVAVIEGLEGQSGWFASDVLLSLNEQDNAGGMGVDYTMYAIDGKNWEVYKNPLVFTSQGHYLVSFYSADNDENIEDIKKVEFNIDKTIPVVSIDATPKEIWPPNGKMVDILVTGKAEDDHLYTKQITVEDEYNTIQPVISDFGQTIQLQAKREGIDLDGRLYILKVEAQDLAGNKAEKQTQVIVPHDKR